MNQQDTQMLTTFLGQLTQAHGVQKDAEADALIQRAVAQQPDAAYLLVQRALLLDQALNNAKSQIAALQEQVRSGGQGGGKFLDADSWGNSGNARPEVREQQYGRDYPRDQQQYQPLGGYPQQGGYPQGGYPQAGYQQPVPSSSFLRGGFGGTLGTIAATAAGVAAGGFLFQGLENMFGGHHENGGGANHLLSSDDQGNNLFSDQSGTSLADQAGVGDVGQSSGNGGGGASESLFDNGGDSGSGFFDGDGSDEGLFS